MAYLKIKKGHFYLLVTLMLLIFFHYLSWLQPIENLTRQIFSPVLTKLHLIKAENITTDEISKQQMAWQANWATCQTERQDQAVLLAQYKILTEENKELKSQLNFRERKSIPSVTARVIGKDSEDSDRAIIINAGELAGIKMEQPVVVGEGILIGKVIQVEKDLSFVRLINDNNSKVAATILNHKQSLGIVEGGYGLSVKMNFIPRNEVVLNNDQVITSGLELNVPRGLLIGTIAAIENEAYQPFQQAILTPAVDLSKLTVISVLLTN